MRSYKPFDAATVPLQQSNLIEASAGTGKTYSIAILVLRLVLENKLPLKEILMVTFTKAAVAELEARIRLFIRNAYKVSQGEKIDDETITHIVTSYSDNIIAQRLLKEAVLFLDETSVLTIHSFCQKTLGEFAFETNQLFGAETLQDIGAVMETEINKFWRTNITSIPAALLTELQNDLKREHISKIVSEHLGGKKYFNLNPSQINPIHNEDYLKIIIDLKTLKTAEEELINELINYVINHSDELKSDCEKNTNARKHLLHLVDTPNAFLEAVKSKSNSQYIINLFPQILESQKELGKKMEERNQQVCQVINQINRSAITAVSNGIQAYKMRNNQMSFDDMIVKLHEALVVKNSENLAKELQKKYKAVFVDEFQDTDRMQYDIFQKAFHQHSILFYIGDPKQSIYAWRKADIFTYFKAYDEVDHLYDMNLNFRSSAPMIDAMNVFFKPTEHFDTFAFNNAEHAINYIPVQSPEGNAKGALYFEQNITAPITINKLPNNDEIYNAVTAQVADLLANKNYSIGHGNNARQITPNDIGILVKTNKQGRAIKNSLSKKGIPAVTIGDEKVLDSDEAKYLLYLLQAMAEISKAGINKALLTPFTGFTVSDILHLNDEKALELFKKYKLRWLEDGIYTALIDFVSDFNIQHVLLERQTENGERIIANLYHLIELVHKIQSTKKLSPAELISWLKRGIEGRETEGDEYEQRVESDEEAIRIVTIHKSKGLEYKIVLSPFMDFVEPKDPKIYSFRDETTADYVVVEARSITAEQKRIASIQMEQEYRRLLYVAITRAVYKCFIYKNNFYKNSTISTFINALPGG